MKFETIDEMAIEIEKRTVVVDSSITCMLHLYNSASFFVLMMNIIIGIIMAISIFLTDVFKGDGPSVFCIYMIIVVWEWLTSMAIRKKLDKHIIQMKYDLAWSVFIKFKYFDTIDDQTGYFERNLIKYAGLRMV